MSISGRCKKFARAVINQEMPYSVELHEKLQGRPVEFVYLCTSSDKGDFDREIVKLGIADTGKNIWLDED